MATATDDIFKDVIDICDGLFWETITYNGVSITSKVGLDSDAERQDGLVNGDGLIVVKIEDVASPVPGVDDCVVRSVAYKVGNIFEQDDRTFSLIINKV